MKQRLIMWLAVVAGVVLVLAVAWAAILWTRPEPIRIAFANSLSGPSAPAGTESLVATQLAIDEVNAKGGVNGRPIELVPVRRRKQSSRGARECAGDRRQPVRRRARTFSQLHLARSRAGIQGCANPGADGKRGCRRSNIRQ